MWGPDILQLDSPVLSWQDPRSPPPNKTSNVFSIQISLFLRECYRQFECLSHFFISFLILWLRGWNFLACLIDQLSLIDSKPQFQRPLPGLVNRSASIQPRNFDDAYSRDAAPWLFGFAQTAARRRALMLLNSLILTKACDKKPRLPLEDGLTSTCGHGRRLWFVSPISIWGSAVCRLIVPSIIWGGGRGPTISVDAAQKQTQVRVSVAYFASRLRLDRWQQCVTCIFSYIPAPRSSQSGEINRYLRCTKTLPMWHRSAPCEQQFDRLNCCFMAHLRMAACTEMSSRDFTVARGFLDLTLTSSGAH